MNDKKPLSIPMIPVVSSNVAAVGYDLASKTLAVEFKQGGHVYHYPDCSQEMFEKLRKAESTGAFVSEHVVKKKMKFEKFRKD